MSWSIYVPGKPPPTPGCSILEVKDTAETLCDKPPYLTVTLKDGRKFWLCIDHVMYKKIIATKTLIEVVPYE